MSFLFGNPFDELVDKATDENTLVIGNTDFSLAFQVADQIKSKQVQPQQAIKSLKRRLGHKNPNVVLHTLNLLDICVKNGGHHFLVQVASVDFMDQMVSIVNGGLTTPQEVRIKVLGLIQNWGLAFKSKQDLYYVYQVYEQLKREGRTFPPVEKVEISSVMIDTMTAPEWTDSYVCTRCRTAFTTFNRKHHCRNCGNTFCNDCSSRTCPLPHLAIDDPVRVCDSCFSRLSSNQPFVPNSTTQSSNQPSSQISQFFGSAAADEDVELRRAIAASLQETKKAAPVRRPVTPEDEQLKAAIAASLKEAQKPIQKPVAQIEVPPYQYQPKPAADNTNDLTGTEKENIKMFAELVEKMEADFAMRGPFSLNHQTQLQALNMQMMSLQPKLSKCLLETSSKYSSFVALNEKMVQAIKIYDQMLQDRLAVATGSLSYPTYAAPDATAKDPNLPGNPHFQPSPPTNYQTYQAPPVSQAYPQYQQPYTTTPQPYPQHAYAPPPQQQQQQQPCRPSPVQYQISPNNPPMSNINYQHQGQYQPPPEPQNEAPLIEL